MQLFLILRRYRLTFHNPLAKFVIARSFICDIYQLILEDVSQFNTPCKPKESPFMKGIFLITISLSLLLVSFPYSERLDVPHKFGLFGVAGIGIIVKDKPMAETRLSVQLSSIYLVPVLFLLLMIELCSQVWSASCKYHRNANTWSLEY